MLQSGKVLEGSFVDINYAEEEKDDVVMFVLKGDKLVEIMKGDILGIEEIEE